MFRADYPTCEQWWTDPTAGVRAGIVTQSSTTMQQLGTALEQAFSGSTSDDRADAIARAAIVNSPPPTWVDVTNTLGESHADLAAKAIRGVGGAVGTLFTMIADISTMMASSHMVNALAMMQALILMCIYMLLPLIVLLSGYKLEVMFYGAMAIFTVKFWTVLWFVAQWLDSYLMASMYPNPSVTTVLKGVWNGSIYKGVTMDILLFAMYIVFPMIWSGMMAWIGIRVGNELTGIMQSNAHPASAGNNTEMHVPGSSKFKK